jgi:aminopeptidase-like protein
MAVRTMMNLLAYADGQRTLLEIADKIDRPMWELVPVAERLCAEGLMKNVG